ncbi:MAG: RNA-directed DNA polymerase [Culturomica sp.]|jgi:hypothetical protein|nr:RNA-directed DNA polymerase [Culturomica sp.]
MRSILDFTNSEAQAFFLKGESYCNIDLPLYFDFNNYIKELYKALNKKEIHDCCEQLPKPSGKGTTPNYPHEHEGVSYQLLTNKDGKYSWRPLQFIHPVLYCLLVKTITDSSNWVSIVKYLKDCAKNKQIECISLPIESTSKKSDKAESIRNWWDRMEQQSIKLSLLYDCILVTDISDCYGSIYTHSIPWALHTKTEAKKKTGKLLGDEIDKLIREMRFGQTNGIPQGSVLMDFIAEIILGYVDVELSAKIKKIKDYKILRYRDDYRIFCNNTNDLEFIAKALSESLADIGLKLNSSKTFTSSDVIKSSIKPDKYYHIANTPIYARNRKSLFSTIQKELLYIHDIAAKYPNSGTLSTLLTNLYEKVILKSKDIKEDVEVLVSITVDIALKNPRTYSAAFAIVSKLLEHVNKTKRKNIVKQILGKFDKVPNTGHMQIWLQRLCHPLQMSLPYTEKMCSLVEGKKEDIWESCWLNPTIKTKMDSLSYIDKSKLTKMPKSFDLAEIKFFEY